MATPRADTYSAASGAAIYAGMAAPSSLPLWLQGKPLNEWFQIANTAVVNSGAAAHAFSGMALAEVGGRAHCVVAAAGGHSDSFDNRVVSLDLMTDAPAWTLRHANTSLVSDPGNQRYNPVNQPVSRHTYSGTAYVPQIDRVMLVGASGVWGFTSQLMVDGFNLNTNHWDGVVDDFPGTSGSGYADCTALVQAAAVNPLTGDIWSKANYFQIYKWSASTRAQTLVRSDGTEPLGPCTWDSTRSKVVFFGAGDSGAMAQAFVYPADGSSRQALTFNASAAHTSLAATPPDTAGVTYDPVADKFYWFRADEGGNKVYVITPNAGYVWDIALLSQGAGTSAPPTGGFTYNRFRYVPSLNGLVYFPANSGTPQNGYFMRLR